MIEHKDTYDQDKVDALIGRMTAAAKELDCNLLEFQAAASSVKASVDALLNVRIETARNREL